MASKELFGEESSTSDSSEESSSEEEAQQQQQVSTLTGPWCALFGNFNRTQPQVRSSLLPRARVEVKHPYMQV